MIYKVIGAMSGSSMDGLDLAFAAFQEKGGVWSYDFIEVECFGYEPEWQEKLREAPGTDAASYLILDKAYGRYMGEKINSFIQARGLEYQVNFICSHGHTVFHQPANRMTAQLGDGASIAAETGLPVISDLRSMDIALGGQGAPLVPVGEKYLFSDFELLLNLGGIANISRNLGGEFQAFDICPANALLNSLASLLGRDFDENGAIAASGSLDTELLRLMNLQDYYHAPFPKSLDNGFGMQRLLPLMLSRGSAADGLRTSCEHIAVQIANSLTMLGWHQPGRMLVTGGGAFNGFLIKRIAALLADLQVTLVLPDDRLIKFKEALIMAFLGILRWRQMDNSVASVTGASRNSCGGAIWSGREM